MRRGLAIVNMLIFVVVFSLLAATMLGLMSSSTRQVEADVRRIRGWYAAEAINVLAMHKMRLNAPVNAAEIAPWSIDEGSGAVVGTKGVVVTTNNVSLIDPFWAGVVFLNTTSNYTSSVW